MSDFRKPNTEISATEEADQVLEEESEIVFDIELPAMPQNTKVRKLKIAKLPAHRTVQNKDSFTYINEAKRWKVRGFWRQLSDGRFTWVSPHQRHHDDKEVTEVYLSVKRVPIAYRFKDNYQITKLKNEFAKRYVRGK